jgi:16S rRNA (guanine1207-N2)-methyltransferase
VAVADPALQTLMLPMSTGMLPWPAPGGVLFLRARTGEPLRACSAQGVVCEQSFRPWADALRGDGFEVSAHDPRPFPLVLVLAPRQRDERRALLARALSQRAPGGIVVACAANDEGGRSLAADLAQLAGPVQGLSKHHCRVSWSATEASVDAGRMREWLALDAPRPILDGRYQSRPGLFAWDRIDAGSALLVQCLPGDLAGRGADLGAGYGYLSRELIERCPGVTALDLYEAESRALEQARVNLAQARLVPGLHWHDVTAGLPHTYDFIVSNPPFHQGRADEPALGQAFLRAAAAALVPGGRLLVVANRHLPYEATLAEGFAEVRVLREADGFKVIHAVRGPA